MLLIEPVWNRNVSDRRSKALIKFIVYEFGDTFNRTSMESKLSGIVAKTSSTAEHTFNRTSMESKQSCGAVLSCSIVNF